MSVNLQYVASSGNVYNLKGDGIRTKTANYHRWNWGVNGTTLQYGTRVAAFTRAAATYETRLILPGSWGTRNALLNALHEEFEQDVRSKKPGRIIWGDYYIECYITSSSTFPDANNIWTDNDLTIYCPYPFWIREETKEFSAKVAPEEETYLDYAYDYSYDYAYGTVGVERWVLDFPFASEFELVFFGPANNPRILVNGHAYQVNDSVGEDEYIKIVSRDSTVTKYTQSGQALNIFDLRDKTESVFEPMPGGTLTFNWSGAFGFNLTLFEERSEPRSEDGRYSDLMGNEAVLTVERW